MTPDQFNLMQQAARTLLAHRDSGRHCDPEGIKWAEQLLKQNPAPKVEPTKDEE